MLLALLRALLFSPRYHPLSGGCPKQLRSIHYSGFGTEQVETEAQELFPEARVGRLDFDTTRRRRSFEDIIRRFETQNLDIMVGTQMIAKVIENGRISIEGKAEELLLNPDIKKAYLGF